MSAGMHKAFIYGVKSLFRRSVARIMLLEYAEGIDIKPHGNRRALAAAQDSDHSGHSSLCVFHELRICPLGNRALILFLQLLIGRNAHSGILFADLVPHEHFISEIRQFSRNDGRSPHLKPARLRILMKITSLCHKIPGHLIGHRVDLIINIHSFALPCAILLLL